MSNTPWETPIAAPYRRSLELVSVCYEPGAISVLVEEEETQKQWRVRFTSTQGLRVTSFESAYDVLKNITGEGGLFEMDKSVWLRSLGAGQREFMNRARHFVICCYDQVVEVAAWNVSIDAVPLGEQDLRRE